MSKLDGINTDMSGKIGRFVYRRTKKGTVVAQAPRKYAVPRRSEKQMYLRCQIANMTANYHLFDDMLELGFEGKTSGQCEYNMYLKANYGKNPVFITKGMRAEGGVVLAPYTFTQGSLSVIGYDLNGSGVLVSSLALGGLTINAETTVGDLAQAVIKNNAGWKDQDQLTFFYAVQWADASGMPRATMNSWKLVLDLYNETPLSDVVSSLGFTSLNGYLGMSTALVNAGAAWVHSRNCGDGIIKVGSQKLFVVSSILSAFQSANAMKVAADSYGGFNNKAVYFDPKANASLADIMDDMSRDEDFSSLLDGSNSASTPGTDGSNSGPSTGSGTNSGTGSDTGNGGNSGNSGNSGGTNSGTSGGGSSTGSETSGTPVLTISKTGNGSASVTAGGNMVNSGASIAEDTQVTITITPATGMTPSATINGNNVSLTEDSGTYSGSFAMPGTNATLVINTGSSGDGDTN